MSVHVNPKRMVFFFYKSQGIPKTCVYISQYREKHCSRFKVVMAYYKKVFGAYVANRPLPWSGDESNHTHAANLNQRLRGGFY